MTSPSGSSKSKQPKVRPSQLTHLTSLANPQTGGSNPAIRTLFYRLARLLSLSIEPVFVFDGPRKPAFKRNKRSIQGDRTSAALAKRLIDLFGFIAHDAPGEAEAECALLQQRGVVDAVLSEDVDTIMFGCTRTLRNWTAEGRGSKTPSHVSVYGVDDEGFKAAGLEREGMVLVALMSGGDYLPEGIPRCGPKVASEAARAGFGKSLCKLKRSDTEGLRKWKEELVHELRTNDSGYFRTKHKALAIPDSFPSLDVLRYYTHPVVSNTTSVERLRAETQWSRGIDMVAMRHFVEETFDWTFRIGADKLIRVLAPSLLVQKLMARYQHGSALECTEEAAEHEESSLIRKISGRRTHFSTDGIPELRVQFVPADIAGLDLSLEKEEEEVASYGRDGLALNSDDEFEEAEGVAAAPKKTFDPTAPDAMWVAESILKLGAPLMVGDFEAEERRKLEKKKAPKAAASRKKAEAPPSKTLDAWVKLTKPPAAQRTTSASPKRPSARLPGTSGLPPTPAKAKPAPEPAAPRPKSKPTSSSAPAPRPVSHASPPRTAADPILLSSSPARPATPARGPAEGGAVGGAAAPEGAAKGARAGPRLRMPPGPPDTPPWLRELCEGTRVVGGSPARGGRTKQRTLGEASPVRREGTTQGALVDKSPARGEKTKQGTLDAFLGSPSKKRAEAKAASPKAKAASLKAKAAGVHKRDTAPPTGTLFPITKKGAAPKPSKGRAGSREPRSIHGVVKLYDPFVDDPEDRFDKKRPGESEVTVIDLTGDDD